jgi:predicted dienelactone hydrolase
MHLRRLARASLGLALAAAAPARAVDPSQDGRFAVGRTTLPLEDASRARTIVTELWYPAERAGVDVPPRAGRFRLVLALHGQCGSRTNYTYLAAPLASSGFVVAAPGLPGLQAPDCESGGVAGDAQGDLAFVRGVLRDRSGPAAAFAASLRRGRIGMLAHSLGGFLALRASLADPEVRALALLAPFTGAIGGADLEGLRPRRALLVVGGTADARIPFEASTQPFFDELPGPAFLVKILGGTHAGFGDADAGSTPEALARQHLLARRYVTAFLRRYLAGDRRFARFLRPEDAAALGADVELSARRR